MKIYTYSEARQNLASVLDEARRKGGVRIRRRDGAVNWAVYRDSGKSGRYVETFLVESWLEHLRQHERVIAGDRAVEASVRQFHIAAAPPVVSHLVAMNVRRS